MENKEKMVNGKEVCPCCGKHCPVDKLHCSKGKEHFGIAADNKEREDGITGNADEAMGKIAKTDTDERSMNIAIYTGIADMEKLVCTD